MKLKKSSGAGKRSGVKPYCFSAAPSWLMRKSAVV